MLLRSLRRALVPLAVLAVTVGSVPAAADPLPPEAEGEPVETLPEPVQPPPDSAPAPEVPPETAPTPAPDLEPPPASPTAGPEPVPSTTARPEAVPPQVPSAEPEPEPVPAPEPVPPTTPEPPRDPEPATPPVAQPQPPVPVPPPPLWLPFPGRAVACDAVTGPVPLEETVVAAGIRVHPCLASRVRALVAMAASHSVVLTGGGWRSNQRQIELRRAHCGTSHFAIWSMPSGRCSPPTARPGRSRHERGLAIDFNNCSTRATVCWSWLNHHAPLFGLYNLPSEPWHWSIDGS